MPLSPIHLRKLLQLFFLDRRGLVSELREDIRRVIAEERGIQSTGGGDFHSPFWTDAKSHVAGRVDLREAVEERVASNWRRSRLYPQLAEGFLTWWEDRRRWNEPYAFYEQSVKARHTPLGVDVEIKVENLLALRVGSASRLYYPYFCEEPSLSEDAARLGLWLMGRALPQSDPEDLRLLDLIRGRSFALGDVSSTGHEEREFIRRYEALVTEWQRLRDEYPPR